MPIPTPYFKNVPGYGNLEMEQVIVDYVYPLLSVLKDGAGNRYLCMCFDTRGAQQWVITPISVAYLKALLRNEITLALPYKDPTSKKVLAVMDYQTREETFQTFYAAQISEEDIPAEGEYLDSEPGEWEEYIRTLENVIVRAQITYFGSRDRILYVDNLRNHRRVGGRMLCSVGS